MTREQALSSMSVAKYGMTYDSGGAGSFTGHEGLINKIYDDFEEDKCETCLYKPSKDDSCWMSCIHNKFVIEDCWTKADKVDG